MSLYWEFLSGNHVAYVEAPYKSDWDEHLPWAAGRKEVILQAVADEVLKGPGRGCRAVFEFPQSLIYFDKIDQ